MDILIVDDSMTIGMAVSQMLTEAHHTPHHVLDGLKAIELLSSGKKVDLILLDWNMPNMSGIEFLEENKKRNLCSCPIVMMTTENKPTYIMKAIELGAKEYIIKPFTSDILISKMDLVING